MKLHSRILIAGTLVAASALAQAEGLTTQDYIDIEQLYSQYNHAIDGCDAEGWAATFTPDGVFQRFTGREALVGFVRQWCEKMNGANRRHWKPNLRITPATDGAGGTVLLMLLDVGVRPRAILSTARTRYARENAGRMALQDAHDQERCAARRPGAGQTVRRTTDERSAPLM